MCTLYSHYILSKDINLCTCIDGGIPYRPLPPPHLLPSPPPPSSPHPLPLPLSAAFSPGSDVDILMKRIYPCSSPVWLSREWNRHILNVQCRKISSLISIRMGNFLQSCLDFVGRLSVERVSTESRSYISAAQDSAEYSLVFSMKALTCRILFLFDEYSPKYLLPWSEQKSENQDWISLFKMCHWKTAHVCMIIVNLSWEFIEGTGPRDF